MERRRAQNTTTSGFGHFSAVGTFLSKAASSRSVCRRDLE